MIAITTCRAITSIGDDHGDNSCTFHCQLDAGHEGLHSEKFAINGKNLTMTWDGTEKVLIEKFQFKVTRTFTDWDAPTATKSLPEVVTTDLISESELFRKYCGKVDGTESAYWSIEDFEPIEGTLVSEWVYEDTNKD